MGWLGLERFGAGCPRGETGASHVLVRRTRLGVKPISRRWGGATLGYRLHKAVCKHAGHSHVEQLREAVLRAELTTARGYVPRAERVADVVAVRAVEELAPEVEGAL